MRTTRCLRLPAHSWWYPGSRLSLATGRVLSASRDYDACVGSRHSIGRRTRSALLGRPAVCGVRVFSTAPPNKGPLCGVRVLDLTRILAGPYCTMILGDLGAEVIKVEECRGGDETRRWGPPFAEGGESAYFLSVNRNKKSICVNLKEQRGKDIIKMLVKECDVLVENFLPGKLDSMGLGFDDLQKVNPRLIYATLSGYGPSGPLAHKPGYDVMASAMGGLMNVTGTKETPCKVGIALTDITTGLLLHGAIMAALLARHRSGRGQRIDASLFESQVALLANLGQNYLLTGTEPTRHGTAHQSIVPYQAFETQDGWLTAGALSDAQWRAMAQAMDMSELADDARFRTNKDRVKHREALLAVLVAKFCTETTAHWVELFDKGGVPCGAVNNMQQVFEHPQVAARDMLVEVEHPTAGQVRMAGIPVKYSESTPSIRSPPPLLGEHTHQVLTELLHLGAKELSELQKTGVIRAR